MGVLSRGGGAGLRRARMAAGKVCALGVGVGVLVVSVGIPCGKEKFWGAEVADCLAATVCPQASLEKLILWALAAALMVCLFH